MKTTTYNTLRKIAAEEKSWWDDYGHKLAQAAIPGLGVWGLGRLLGLDNGIAAALGLGAGAVGWHSGDWAKDWFKKDKPQTGGDADYVTDETDDPGYETHDQEQGAQAREWVKNTFGVAYKPFPEYDPMKAADPTGEYRKQYNLFQQVLRDSHADWEKRDQKEAAKQMQQNIADHDYQQKLRAEEKARQNIDQNYATDELDDPGYETQAQEAAKQEMRQNETAGSAQDWDDSSMRDEVTIGTFDRNEANPAAPTPVNTQSKNQLANGTPKATARQLDTTSMTFPANTPLALQALAIQLMLKYGIKANDALDLASSIYSNGRNYANRALTVAGNTYNKVRNNVANKMQPITNAFAMINGSNAQPTTGRNPLRNR
jgi:hypothetical protein